MKAFSKKDEKLLHLATIGGLTDEEAFWEVYKPKNRKIGLTQLNTKRRKRADLFKKISDYKKELFDAAAQAQREAVKAAATANALTAIEKREKLRMIIEGEAEEDVIFQHMGKALRVKKAPSLSDRIRAIDLDNKMAGHYSPTHIRHDDFDAFIEIMKISSQRKVDADKGEGENIPAKKADDFIDKPNSDNVAG